MISSVWRPTVISGLSATIGSWKIMAMRPPRTARMLFGRQRKQVLAVVEDPAARDAHVRLGQQAQDRLCHHRLAGAGFADHAQDLAAHHLERYAVDGMRPVGPGRQPDGQIFDA